jgi:hypothetical protein
MNCSAKLSIIFSLKFPIPDAVVSTQVVRRCLLAQYLCTKPHRLSLLSPNLSQSTSSCFALEPFHSQTIQSPSPSSYFHHQKAPAASRILILFSIYFLLTLIIYGTEWVPEWNGYQKSTTHTNSLKITKTNNLCENIYNWLNATKKGISLKLFLPIH